MYPLSQQAKKKYKIMNEPTPNEHEQQQQEQEKRQVDTHRIRHGVLQSFVKRKVNQLLHTKFATFLSGNIPQLNHTNFKILLFLSIVLYAYYKITRLNPRNAKYWRLMDEMWFLFISIVKLYYRNEARSDLWLIIRLLLIVGFNRMSGGNSYRTLQEDFFFSSSGNLFISYFFL